MSTGLPPHLAKGEITRLFPVLSTTLKEIRATSILLAYLSNVDEIAREFLASAGQRLGGRFVQQMYFIGDLETITPSIYGRIGSKLIAWRIPASTFKSQNFEPEDVSPDAISEDADSDAFDT